MKAQMSIEVLLSMLILLLIVVSLLAAFQHARQLFSKTGTALVASAEGATAYASELANS